jgi:chromosome segregation protein
VLFLKSIDINGFKTFAEKTSLLFKPGVTAIVGPNGCGKSNIVDAIRWVLGESNARSLRGEIMEDVIFSGSDEKKPLGMAEVAITVVNDDALLPIEYAEVTIKRRLYRSGESEFFINKNSVLMRDVHELFADTGIGKPAYSIMEQGNIDVILSNKPEERMTIFEEAAGITRYKMKIRESHRKLMATDENLVRLNIIIGEVEKEFKNLEKQSDKAALYKRLKKEEIRYETLYNYERIGGLKSSLAKNNEKLSYLTKLNTELGSEVRKLNDLIKKDIDRVRNIENEIVEIKNDTYKKEAELETIASKSSHIDERIHEIDVEIEKKERQISESRERKRELESRVSGLEKGIKEVRDLIFSQEEKLKGYTREVDQQSSFLLKNTKKLQLNAGKMEEIDLKLNGLRESLKEVIDKLLNEISKVRKNFRRSEGRKGELIDEINGSIEQVRTVLRHHQTKLQDLEYSTTESGFRPLLEQLTQGVQTLGEKITQLKLNIDMVINIQDELSRAIFGRESSQSKKEQIEGRIEKLLEQLNALKNECALLDDENRKRIEKKEKFEEFVNNLRPDIARNREKEKNDSENRERLGRELERSEEYLQDIEFEIHALGERKKAFGLNLDTLSEEHQRVEKQRLLLTEKTKNQNSLIDEIVVKIQKNESEVGEKRKKAEAHSGAVDAIEIKNAELTSKIETISENFRERYGNALELYTPEETIDIKMINDKRVSTRNQIAALGQVNLMAIEEFKEVQKRYEYITAQRADLEKAKDDLNIIVSKTLESSKELFLDSFDKIRVNFNSIFKRLFGGGKTDLYLTNESNIFDTGVEIIACPPGKSLKRRSLLSGGEKSLTAIALLFSIFMVRPSPFCMLDEVDHDLDEENVIRFIKLLKEFTDTTQFIIITHNRRTIEFADIIYGVTSEQLGISKVVSLEMMEHAVE